jgi:hypothetical protein
MPFALRQSIIHILLLPPSNSYQSNEKPDCKIARALEVCTSKKGNIGQSRAHIDITKSVYRSEESSENRSQASRANESQRKAHSRQIQITSP